MADNKESGFGFKLPKFLTSEKKFDFSISLPGMISITGMGVLALTFFFIMGILIGRGYRPEANVPPLNDLMPGQEQVTEIEEIPVPESLSTEDLEYPERLKEKPPSEGELPAPEPKAEPKPEPEPAKETKPAQPVEEATKPAPATVETTEQPPAKTGDPVYDFVYQVAAFRKAEMADSLSATLVDAGLRTDIETADVNGVAWHRVLVLHHGTADSVAGLKEILARYKITKPFKKKQTRVD